MQADDIWPKINMFKQYYLHKQEFVYCAHDTATQLWHGIFLRQIAARFSKCPASFGIIILMTPRYLWCYL